MTTMPLHPTSLIPALLQEQFMIWLITKRKGCFRGVSGKGFVASFDASSYGCNFNMFTYLNVTSSCATLTANVSVTPAPPGGSTVTYILMNGTTQVASNNTGIFSGLQPNINYTVNATVNMVCSGAATTTAFVLPGPVVVTSLTNATVAMLQVSVTVNPKQVDKVLYI
ncbi:MAG: hypothetical protein IPN13_14915 [Bacteroidetes bacterium]|nr:hypothetical protein [Bacteroidota bacterium]